MEKIILYSSSIIIVAVVVFANVAYYRGWIKGKIDREELEEFQRFS